MLGKLVVNVNLCLPLFLHYSVDPAKLHGINIKVEVILSKYTNLKEEAVRAFKAYMKHLALMRDKKVFDVMSVDIDAFAR